MFYNLNNIIIIIINRKYNFTTEHLEQGVFLDPKPLTGCEFWWCAVYLC